MELELFYVKSLFLKQAQQVSGKLFLCEIVVLQLIQNSAYPKALSTGSTSADAKEVEAVTAFLFSDDANIFTGATINVDVDFLA